MVKFATEEDLSHGLLGTLTIMARIIDSHVRLINIMNDNNANPYDIPTLEALTLQVVARMKDGRIPEKIVFDEIHKHFLN